MLQRQEGRSARQQSQIKTQNTKFFRKINLSTLCSIDAFRHPVFFESWLKNFSDIGVNDEGRADLMKSALITARKNFEKMQKRAESLDWARSSIERVSSNWTAHEWITPIRPHLALVQWLEWLPLLFHYLTNPTGLGYLSIISPRILSFLPSSMTC